MAQTSGAPVAGDTGTTPGVAVVTGMVFDSVGRTPLAGAFVQMRMEARPRLVYNATTDSAGSYRIERVPRGAYFATFFHPALDTLGLQPMMWRVEVRDSVTRLTYTVPSPATIWAASCRAAHPNDSTGLILGRVHDADTGMPLAGSVVSVTWTELVIDRRGLHTDRQQLAAQTADDGHYALCGIPSDASVQVRAEHGAVASGVVEITAPFHALALRNFGIGSSDSTTVVVADSDSAAIRTGDGILLRRGTARLEGTVRSPAGQPLKDVQLLVRGSAEQATSDTSGRFALANLPSGTYTLEARHVGLAPTRMIVDLASHHTTTVAMTMDKPVPVLNTVRIFGKERTGRSSLTGFLERRKRGFGHFLTREEIEKRHAFEVTDLFRMIPGVRVVPDGTFGHTLVMRGGAGFSRCQPTIYVDGMRIFEQDGSDLDGMLDPQDISGVEVYTGPSQAPVQYQGNGCGSVVIWTGSGMQ